MEKNGADLFLRHKPALALIQIADILEKGNKYASKIAKEIDTTYSHIVKIIKEFERLGLITAEKEGRKKIIRLTDKGKLLAEHFKGVHELLM